METYKRTINLKDFGVLYDSSTSKDIPVDTNYGFLPHSENISGELVIKWGTFNHYLGWLNKFISEADIYELKKRFDDILFVNAREYNSDYINCESFEQQKPVLKDWLSNAVGVYANEYIARNEISAEDCGKFVFIHPDASTFEEMFGEGSIDNAVLLLGMEGTQGSKEQFIELPIYLANDIEDLGTYDVVTDEDSEAITRYRDINSSNEDTVVEKVYVESQLKTLLRQRKNFDDEGNVLPYVYNEEAYRNELPYAVNIPCNAVYSNGAFLWNELLAINYYDGGGIEVVANGKNYYDGTMLSEGIIEFVYAVNKSEGENDGIIYRERRRYTVKADAPNGEAIIVEDETIDNPENYINGKQYATIELDGAYEEVLDTENGVGMIKDDAYLNIQDSKVVTDNVYIDRGVSAAFEAFNVLGETNTIEDIENYRDDWFRIRGKND